MRIASWGFKPHVAAPQQDQGAPSVDLDDLAAGAQEALETLLARATAALRQKVSRDGKLDAAGIEAEQHAAHGLAWLATYAQAVRELAAYRAAHARRRPFRRDRGIADPHRPWRISGPGLRRPADEPRRIRAPRRFRPRRGRRRRHAQGRRRRTHRHRVRRPPTARGSPPSSSTRRRAPSATPASTRRWRRSAPKCAASPTPR